MMDTLCPFGVPKVSSSIPDLAFKPVGLSVEDMVRMNVICGAWKRCFEVCRILSMGERYIIITGGRCEALILRLRYAACSFSMLESAADKSIRHDVRDEPGHLLCGVRRGNSIWSNAYFDADD